MKELYIAPELNVICFAPVERLAAEDDILDADVVFKLTKQTGPDPVASRDEDYDLDVDL